MPELRKDPVVGRWVIIATERARRPSDFVTEPVRPRASACAFCEGHEQQTPPEILAGRPPDGRPNGPGWTYRVVPNKFPALRIEGELEPSGEGLFDRMNGVGAHEVVIETPRHDASLAGLSVDAVADVLFAFRERMLDLKKDPRFAYVLVFKNHGEAAGASLEHPHSQLIATPIIPIMVSEELAGSAQYYDMKERCVWCDMVRQERRGRGRLVGASSDFGVLAHGRDARPVGRPHRADRRPAVQAELSRERGRVGIRHSGRRAPHVSGGHGAPDGGMRATASPAGGRGPGRDRARRRLRHDCG